MEIHHDNQDGYESFFGCDKKNCLDPFSNIWYQLGFRLKDPSTDSRAKQD